MRKLADAYGDRVLIGEIYLPLERLMHYYGREATGVHLPFNFQLIEAPWRAGTIAGLITDYEAALPPHGWPNWVLGNHDRPRVATRVGEAQARVAAMLLLRSEEHTSELQSLMRISYAVFCLKKKIQNNNR